MAILIDTTFTAKNISSAVSVYEYTVPASVVKVRFQVRLYQVAGGGAYTINLRLNDGDAQSDDPIIPKTTYIAATGLQNFWLQSGDVDVIAGDVINVMVLGQGSDTAVIGSIRIFDDNVDTAGVTEILTRIPDATPGASGGLPILNASLEVPKVKTLTDAPANSAGITTILADYARRTGDYSVLTAAQVWNALTSSLTTVGSIGKWILDKLNATISDIPTVEEIDTELSSNHGSGSWGAGNGGDLSLIYTLTDSITGLPIEGATIELYPTDAYINIIDSQVTNALGQVTFSDLVAGTYYLKIIRAGYVTGHDTEVVS